MKRKFYLKNKKVMCVNAHQPLCCLLLPLSLGSSSSSRLEGLVIAMDVASDFRRGASSSPTEAQPLEPAEAGGIGGLVFLIHFSRSNKKVISSREKRGAGWEMIAAH